MRSAPNSLATSAPSKLASDARGRLDFAVSPLLLSSPLGVIRLVGSKPGCAAQDAAEKMKVL
jgi:hypothetical protein